MTLDLSKLAIADSALPESKRGRTATPVPAELVAAVRASYTMPKGQGKSITVPAVAKDIKTLKGFIRRAAESLGYGVSISDGKVNKSSHEVLFRAKDKNKSTPKPTDIYVADDGDGALVWVDEGDEGARLASVTEARKLGFTYDDEAGSWVEPQTTDGDED